MEKDKIRLDILVAKKFNISRNVAKEHILNNFVISNGKILNKPKLLVDETIDLNLKEIIKKKVKTFDLKPSPLKCEIVYEDEYIFIVNKPSGIIVHPTNYESIDTLANIMKRVFEERKIQCFGDLLRNGIVHRLDKDTSGLLIVAKNQTVYDKFVELIKEKKVIRKYLALIYGHLVAKTVDVDVPIIRIDDSNKREASSNHNADDAKTTFIEIEKFSNFSLVECVLHTGRTHQIRVHAQYINNNVLNDPLYGVKHHNKSTKYGQYLVAYNLEFKHPFLSNKKINIKIDMPKEFKKYIKENNK